MPYAYFHNRFSCLLFFSLSVCVYSVRWNRFGMHLSGVEWNILYGAVYICVSDQYIYTRIPHTIFWLISSQIFSVYHFSDANTVSHSLYYRSISLYLLATNRNICEMECVSSKRSSIFRIYASYVSFFLRFAIQQTSHKIVFIFSVSLSCQSISTMRKMYALSLSHTLYCQCFKLTDTTTTKKKTIFHHSCYLNAVNFVFSCFSLSLYVCWLLLVFHSILK